MPEARAPGWKLAAGCPAERFTVAGDVMAQGYLVSFGNGQLNGGDAIAGGLTAFDPQAALGQDTWSYSGVRSDTGAAVTNASGPGADHLATNGDVSIVPTGFTVSGLSGGSAATAPATTARPRGTAAGDAINGNGGDDPVYGGADTSETGTGDDAIDAGGGGDCVVAHNGAAREEIFALFPSLRSMPASCGRAARRCLKAHEARVIRAQPSQAA